MKPTEPTRRSVLGLAGLATASLTLPETAVRAQETARRGRAPLKITDVKTILTQPGGEHLVVVKVLTSEPGLYGVGCATHGERPLAVAAAIDQHVKPLVIGKECDRIEDIWQTSYVASYFRSGVTLNNALSGIDGALWDILGKQVGLPVYKLLGGKVREAVPLYAHASAKDLAGARRPGPPVASQGLPARSRPACRPRLCDLRRGWRDFEGRPAGAAGGHQTLARLRANALRQ